MQKSKQNDVTCSASFLQDKWLVFKDANQSFKDSKTYEFVCVQVLRPSQPNGVMSSAVSLPNHTFTGQA